ncbi:PREDICTED: SUMO-specific isopeptidase USPL1 [Gekko japonicus]|uniref:SUMO-specific isopeptidase USPL1 n=1 Tax=Gekko japonicus TaxID=146911 RepID=A0ABM1L545_GEKJA|nr:PREDICTED: SUMO-specific isopeptidase USPL1 [Gekko japonicus]
MMDYQKIGNGLQVAGIGAPALHMVGYLGKDSKSAEIIPGGHCPLCKKKGLMQVLQTYRINFQESVLFCENPQCIYPLGFGSLSNIIVPIDPKDYSSQVTCRKRKFFETSLVTTPKSASKPDLAPRYNGENLFGTHSRQPDFSSATQPNFNNATESAQQEMEAQEHSPDTLIVQKQVLSNSEPCSSVSKILHQGNTFLSEPRWLQWRNVHALCWLDCILSVLVHLETLKIILTRSVSENLSVIHRLLAVYNQATALVNNCQRGELISEAPGDVLSRAESHLNEIRNTVFEQLQPRLKCTLGKEETPVFAFPLLLQNDPQIEKLFLHSFSWKFECLQCGHQVNDRCQKTLTTFTNIIPEWHPLNAVHVAPCNNCNHRTQRRKMVLEKIPSVLMMHFVEGLPHNDLMTYSFQFEEDSYRITAVLQYLQKSKHFVAWIFNSDGTWLECDDLKGSYCSKHERFGVPPSEVHIVIWERKPPQVTKELNLQLQKGGAREVPLQKAETNSPGKQLDEEATDDTPLLCPKEDLSNAHFSDTQNVVGNDKSNLLWGFENLKDDDEITLTLVNITLDSNGKSLEDTSVTESCPVAEMLQQQDPGRVSVSPLSENPRASLHGGRPNNASTFVMPALSPSNYSPKTLPVQTTLAQNNANPVQASSGSGREKLRSNISRTTSLTSAQETPNALQHTRVVTANSQIAAPKRSSWLPSQKKTKPFITSWVKGLHEQNPFMPKSFLTNNRTESSQKPLQKEIIANPLIKGPSHFGGFLPKHSERKLKKLEKRAFPSLPSASSLVASHPIEKQTFRGEGTVSKIPVTSMLDKQVQPKQNHSGNKNLTAAENGEKSNSYTARQLRIQFRKLCKNKKLALLEKPVNTQVRNKSSPKKSMKEQSQLGSQEENYSLQNLLRELQHHIEAEDGKSVISPDTTTSQCSSDDIISELLSPATTLASPELPAEEECKYLEMGVCTIESPVSSEKAECAEYLNHNYYIPEKEGLRGGPPDILVNESPMNKFYFESPTKHDILKEFPSSELNSIIDSDEVIHHFDESLLI